MWACHLAQVRERLTDAVGDLAARLEREGIRRSLILSADADGVRLHDIIRGQLRNRFPGARRRDQPHAARRVPAGQRVERVGHPDPTVPIVRTGCS